MIPVLNPNAMLSLSLSSFMTSLLKLPNRKRVSASTSKENPYPLCPIRRLRFTIFTSASEVCCCCEVRRWSVRSSKAYAISICLGRLSVFVAVVTVDLKILDLVYDSHVEPQNSHVRTSLEPRSDALQSPAFAFPSSYQMSSA
jgi:hypothetical protein